MTDQFHDIIPGSSIHEVYEDSRKDYEYIQSVAQSVQEDALSHIIEDKKDCYTVFNASGWKRSEIVTVPNERAGIYRDEQGN